MFAKFVFGDQALLGVFSSMKNLTFALGDQKTGFI
jgi:hypothetical protein